jgi:RNA polymerase sigma factor (sigma-70 family)
MASLDSKGWARDLDLIRNAGAVGGLSDAELLGRFTSRRDGSGDVAFGAIVERHGGMVLGICRRVLRDRVEADDAFQATFLVLVQKARSVRVDDSLGPWLSGVARRVATKARAGAVRRQKREQGPTDHVEAPRNLADDPDGLRPALFEELERLPEKYRSPLVLCHLEGKSHEEAARELRWPVGTVSGRLSRARELLRTRLSLRGLSPTASSVGLALSGARSTVPTRTLLETTTQLASRFLAGEAVPQTIRHLAQGVLTTMLAQQIQLGALAVSAVALLTVGGTYVAGRSEGTQDPATPPPAVVQAPAPPRTPPVIFVPNPGSPVPLAAPATPAVPELPGVPAVPQPPASPSMASMMMPLPSQVMIPGFPRYSESATRPRTVSAIPALQTSAMVVVSSSDSRTHKALAIGDTRWREYKVAEGLHSMPVASRDLLALAVSGPNVRELAVFLSVGPDSNWYTQALPGPTSGEFVPVVSGKMAYYQVGNDFYALSAQSGKWGVLRLEGKDAAKAQFGCNEWPSAGHNAEPSAIMVQQGRKLYVFSGLTGQWSDGVDLPEPTPPPAK